MSADHATHVRLVGEAVPSGQGAQLRGTLRDVLQHGPHAQLVAVEGDGLTGHPPEHPAEVVRRAVQSRGQVDETEEEPTP